MSLRDWKYDNKCPHCGKDLWWHLNQRLSEGDRPQCDDWFVVCPNRGSTMEVVVEPVPEFGLKRVDK